MRDIKNFEGLYAATEDGRIYSYKSKRFLKPTKNSRGYYHLSLWKEGRRTDYLVHRLIAATFIPNPNNLETVDHINSNKLDNRVENLQWLTREDNARKGTSKAVRCIETQRTFKSIREAGRHYGISESLVGSACRHTGRTAGGRHFMFEEEYIDNIAAALLLKTFEDEEN